jgi:hypothetical protein
MSWIQWQGRTIPHTQDCAELECMVHAPDMGGPRQNWSLGLSQNENWPAGVPGKLKLLWRLALEIQELGIEVQDVRELSGLVIRSTPEWLKRVQESTQHGHLVEPMVRLHYAHAALETGEFDVWEDYFSVEWELRFGRLDGLSLPCELDVWALIPEKEFYRTEPETEAELARFAEGEPTLRVMTRADIACARVEMERCGDDPVPLARQRLHAAVGGLEVPQETLFWENNDVATPNHKAVKEPGWRSTVLFHTGA